MHPTSITTLLQHYEAIAALSSRMLETAQAGDWDKLAALCNEYHDGVEQLRKLEPLDTDQRSARRVLLTRILENDARIRSLLAPELDRLGQMISTFKRQRALLRAYYSSVRHD